MRIALYAPHSGRPRPGHPGAPLAALAPYAARRGWEIALDCLHQVHQVPGLEDPRQGLRSLLTEAAVPSRCERPPASSAPPWPPSASVSTTSAPPEKSTTKPVPKPLPPREATTEAAGLPILSADDILVAEWAIHQQTARRRGAPTSLSAVAYALHVSWSRVLSRLREPELIEEERSPRCITHPAASSQEKPR